MVRLRLTPKRRADLLVLLGVVLISAGCALVSVPAGVIVAGIAAVLSGLFLVTNVEGAHEPTAARPKRRRKV